MPMRNRRLKRRRPGPAVDPAPALASIGTNGGANGDGMGEAATFGRLERSQGRAQVRFEAAAGTTRLRDLHQSGSAKALLPRTAAAEVVFLNTSGGLTGGDRLHYGIGLGPGARLSAMTQTAERAYASPGPAAHAEVVAEVGAGGRLDWLPQETLIYEASHLERTTTIDLAGGAAVLLCEAVVLGRHAMGEAPRSARLSDRRMVRRNGRPVWAEALRLDAGLLADADHAALLGPARAFAVVAFVAPAAADALAPLRAVLNEPGCEAAASAWNGRCVVRVLARDGWPLRRQLSRALRVLRGGSLPRVWQLGGEAA